VPNPDPAALARRLARLELADHDGQRHLPILRAKHGQFLAPAACRLGQTLFVFVADHTAGSAGKEDLPVVNYQIPLFIYAPDLIKPGEVSTLASQIDLAPTLLGLLNFNYTSTFFGRNVLRDDTAPGRALIGNYQHLGLFDGRNLVILSPRRGVRRHEDALGAVREVVAEPNDLLLRRNIAYYHVAKEAAILGCTIDPAGRSFHAAYLTRGSWK
jgi:hypothetical protein